MKLISLILLVFVIETQSFDLDKNENELFTDFIHQFHKEYRNEKEREGRFHIFKINLKRIKELNKERKSELDAYYTINEFSDLLDNELPIYNQINQIHSNETDHLNESLFINIKEDKKWNKIPDLPEGNNLPENHAYCGEYVKKNTNRPQIDFCGKVVSQGKCGGCWATSLVNLAQYIYSNLTYERHGCIKTPPIFSCQRFLDVTQTKATKRCCGGNPKDAMDKVPSFSLENDYPFIDYNNKICSIRGDQNPNVQLQMAINGYKTFGIRKEENMVLLLKKILHHYGPFLVSIKVSGTNFNSYSHGIFEFPNTSICDTSSSSFMTDHEVVLMGWGKEKGIEYFIIRNSWAKGWGEGDNYMRIKTTNLCGIGWRIGDNVYPLNMLVFANTCKFDKHCKKCNINTNKCLECHYGYKFNNNNQCKQSN